jgi:ribonucleoside-diphosphate reductase alpha chain
LQKYIDQSISANTSYNPAHYQDNQLSMNEMLRHMLMMYKFGLKTAYYFNQYDGQEEVNADKLIKEMNAEKKSELAVVVQHDIHEEEESEEDCESCKI